MAEGVDTSGRDPETLGLYVEESLEGLQQIDQLLLDAERGAPAPNMMATLFRTVHTIKGTAGYLALERTQALSHAAEDLLSRLRDGKLTARADHFACLLSVGERLRAMVENVRVTGDEGDIEVASLVAALQASLAAEGSVGGPSPAKSAEAIAASATAALAEKEARAQGAPGQTVATAPATAPSPAAAAAPASTASAAAIAVPASFIAAASTEVPTPAEGMDVGTPSAEARSAGEVDAVASPKDKAAVAARTDTSDGTVRVNVAVLDRLMNLIGELVLSRNQIVQLTNTSSDHRLAGQAAFQRLNVVTSELQEQVMKTRMQPVARVFEKIPRMVRDVARVVNKKVRCEIEGNATEIDKALVEAIRDPVMHIVRNALDHGIETPEERLKKGKQEIGTLYVRAAHKGGAVTIEIEDDGKGMDPAMLRAHAVKKGLLSATDAAKLSDREALGLVFRPGFSTAAKVTDISGRGVGMDVVRTHVEQAGGEAEIESVAGQGSIIRLKMPLTLAIIPALLVRANAQRFAIPQVNLLELVYLPEDKVAGAIESVRGASVHKLRGEILPVVYLREALGLPPLTAQEAALGTYCVVLASGARRYSLVVDAIDNTEEIVIKPLRGQLKRLSSYSGATVLGDGNVALILDVAGIAARAGIDLAAQRRAEQLAEIRYEAKQMEQMMVFRTLGGLQCAVPLSAVARLEQVQSRDIERLGSREVLQYRGSLLPVVRPESILTASQESKPTEEQRILVFEFGQRVGMAVAEVLDVTEVDVKAASNDNNTPGVYAKTVVYGRTTLLLDVYQILRQLLPDFMRQSELVSHGRVLVADRSAALRSSFAGFLRSKNFEVVTVASRDALQAELRQKQGNIYDAIVAEAEVLPDNLSEFNLGPKAAARATTLFVWTHQAQPKAGSLLEHPAVENVFSKMDREGLHAALLEAHTQAQTQRKAAASAGKGASQ